MSKAADIAAAISVRVSGVLTTAGAFTDIGTRVYRGRRSLDENAIPCAVILESDDTVQASSRDGQVKVAQRYVVEGHAPCDPDNPNDMAHDIIADLKTAIFGGDENLGGLVSELRYVGRVISPRTDGLAFVAASIEFEVDFVETLASP